MSWKPLTSSDNSAWTSCWWWKSRTTGLRGRLFCFAFCLCSAPSICSVCYVASRLARVVLVNIRRLFCWSCGICLLSCLFLWRVVLPCKAAFLAYLAFLMVFCLQPQVLSKLVSMACVTFKLPFCSVCHFQTRFHVSYYSPLNFHSRCCFRVVFIAYVTFKLLFWHVSSSS